MTLKLGFHFLPGDRAEARAWYALGPSTVKFALIDLDWANDADNQALVNAAPPGCLVVGKLNEPAFNIEQGEPTALAGIYAHHFLPMIDALPRVDIWEGLNEVGIRPEELNRMRRHSIFSWEFARQIYMMGKRAGIGAWATGNPPSLDQWDYWQEGLRACSEYGAIFTRHNYGPLDNYLGLRHRADRMKWNDLGFGSIPVLITECGADTCGVPGWDAYRTMGWSIERYYAEWIKPFTLEINQDPYVIGGHIFTLNGGGGWPAYDVAHSGLLEILQRDIAALEMPAEPPATKETVMEEFSFITTLLGTGSNTAALHDFLFKVHDWLAKHNGSITGFGEASPWWKVSTLPKFCTLRPEFGQRLLYWPSPDVTQKPTLFPNAVTWQMQVFGVQGDMALVNQTPPMWIPAAYAQAV